MASQYSLITMATETVTTSNQSNKRLLIVLLIFSLLFCNYKAQISVWNDASEKLPSTRCCQVSGYDATTGLAWILGGWVSGSGTGLSDIYSWNIASGIITHRGQLSIGNVSMTFGQVWTTIGTTIYFIKDQTGNDISSFNMSTGTIVPNSISTAPMSESAECMTSYLNKYLIVIGYKLTNIYDFETKQWLGALPSLNMPREATSCQVYDKSVYIIGGRHDGSSHLNTIEKLNLTTINTLSNWVTLTGTSVLSFETYLLRSTLVGDRIVVTGGYNGGYLNNVNVISTADDSVSVETSFTRAINRHAIITGPNNEVIIIGGRGVGSATYDAITISNPVMTFDPTESPTDDPTELPTKQPTTNPTMSPTAGTTFTSTKFINAVTDAPSTNPTIGRSKSPSKSTNNPTYRPTKFTKSPTLNLGVKADESNEETMTVRTETWVWIVISVAGFCCIVAVIVFWKMPRDSHVITMVYNNVHQRTDKCVEEIEENHIDINKMDTRNTYSVHSKSDAIEGNVEWMSTDGVIGMTTFKQR